MLAMKRFLRLSLLFSGLGLAEVIAAKPGPDVIELTPRDTLIESGVNACQGVLSEMKSALLDRVEALNSSVGEGVRHFPAEYEKARVELERFWERNNANYSPGNQALERERLELVDKLNAALTTNFKNIEHEFAMRKVSLLLSDLIALSFGLSGQLDDFAFAWKSCHAESGNTPACRSHALAMLDRNFSNSHAVLGKVLPRMIYAGLSVRDEWWVACRAPV